MTEQTIIDSTERYFSRGQTIQTDTNIYIIVSGYVGLYSESDGIRRLLFVYKEGDIFPLMGSSDMFPDRTYSYISMNKSMLRMFSNDQYEKLLRDPETARTLILHQQQIMQLQIDRINNLQRNQVGERLLERLLFYARRLGIRRGDRVRIEVPMSHVDLATSIGTSRETVNRYMKQLEARGILSVNKQRITILSMKKLEAAWHNKQIPAENSWPKLPKGTMLQLGVTASGAAVFISGMSLS